MSYARKITYLSLVLFVMTGVEASEMMTTSIPFQDSANGGTLILVETLNRNARYVEFDTTQGDLAESVADGLADLINVTDPFEWNIPAGFFQVSAENGVLKGLIGSRDMYILAGNETGLGIPRPPVSLSCVHDPEEDSVVVTWDNPKEGYDNISITLNWSNYDHRGCETLPGSAERLVIRRKDRPVNLNDLDICVIGIKAGIPSNAGMIHLSNNGRTQEELSGIPFYNGVAPNWQAWHIGSGKNNIQFGQEVRGSYTAVKGNRFNPILHGGTKPFYQVIKTTSKNIKGGVYRKFLGLTPGHTYRLSARLSTLAMDSAKNEWSLSLHATYNKPGGTDLTVQQLAGLAALPDGSSGPQTGRIALYEPGATTNGNFIERSTDKSGPGREISDITLPKDVDTITVWVRHSGSDSNGVALEWVRLEDISAK